MRVLHATYMARYFHSIALQMQTEQDAAAELEIPWTSLVVCNQDKLQVGNLDVIEPINSGRRFTGVAGKIWIWLAGRSTFYKIIRKRSANYDVILLRYSVHDPFMIWHLLRSQVPTLLVRHTFESKELALRRGPVGFLTSNADKIFEVVAGLLCHGFVVVTSELGTYANRRNERNPKKIFEYPNGVLLSDTQVNDQRGNIPELLFVASNFYPWHGLDLLVKSAMTNGADCRIHIVGELSVAQIEMCSQDSRFILHGKLETVEIENLTFRCWIGISSLALQRNGMEQACPLKNREYLAHGLPVCGDFEEVFPPEFLFYQRVKPKLSEILEFAHWTRRFSKEEVRMESSALIDKRRLMKNLYDNLNNEVFVLS